MPATKRRVFNVRRGRGAAQFQAKKEINMADASSMASSSPYHSSSSRAETNAPFQHSENISLGEDPLNNGDGLTHPPLVLSPTVVSRENSPAKTGNPVSFRSLEKWKTEKTLACSTPQLRVNTVLPSQRGMANQHFNLLMDAVREGDAAEVQKLLELGVDIGRPDSDGLTALHHAATNGHLRIVHLLVRHGAKIPAATSRGYTPLAMAANSGHLAVVEYLIHFQHNRAPRNENRTASPTQPAARSSAAPGEAGAVSSDGLDIFEAMAKAYASRTNDEHMKELANAVKKGSLEGVVRMIAAIAKSLALKELVSRIGTVEEFQGILNAHLADACRDGRVDIVLALLCAGVQADVPDRYGATPLMHAATSNQPQMVTALLKAGAGLDKKDKRGHSALSLAIDDGYLDVLKALVDGKADIWNATAWDEPIIYYAAANQKKEIVRTLLALRADLLDADGSKALARYARAGSRPAVSTLLSAGADPNHRAANGHTAFTLAAANGHKKVLALLLDTHAGVEWQRSLQAQCDKQGRTALMLAALNDEVETARYLLDHYADLRQRDFAGRNALLWAAVSASTDMLDLLAKRGAKHECADDHGDTIFTIAAGHNNWFAMNALCKATYTHQFGLDTPNRDGDTALIKAARGGFLEIVRLLNCAGANMLATNSEGKTAIHEAAAHGHSQVVTFLQKEVAALPKVYPYANGALSLLGRLPLVSVLLPQRVQVRVQELDMDGNSLVMVAASNGRETLLRELFELQFDAGDDGEQGAGLFAEEGRNTLALAAASPVAAPSSPSKINIEQTNREGMTALCQAARHGQYGAMKFLIDQGARANGAFHIDIGQGKTLITPLWLVCRLTHPAGKDTGSDVFNKVHSPEMLVQLLLEHGAGSDINTPCGKLGQTPLLAAAVAGRAEVVTLLLEHGASIAVCDIHGIGPLMHAAWHGRRDVVELLLNHGAGANVKHGEISALILAAENEHIEVVQLLAKRGANLDHADSLGTTALIGATRRGKAAAVRSLIALGANLHHVDQRGNSALYYASRDHHDEIIGLLGKGAPPPRNS
jgi:ankyrin repeat protein